MPETTQFSGMGDTTGSDSSLKANSVLHTRYKILGIIGGGGMGTVYQARDLNFTDVKRLVAVKEMLTATTDRAMRESMLKNFKREANILAQLNHPAIPRIFDVFEMNERAYLVMEYINGSDLELLMQKTKELPIDKIVEWAIDLCDVLDYLHNQKPDTIIFRDMKPSNVMIDSLGKVRLIDFGIARTFTSGAKGTMIGTEGYSAPEQYKGEATPQSDIYSLGATLHHILTRKDPRLDAPFTFHERPIANFNQKAPPDFVRIIEKALSFNATERYATCAEMKADIERVKLRMSGMMIAPADFAVADKQTTGSGPKVSSGAHQAVLEAQRTSFFDGTENAAIQPRWVFKTEDEIRSSPAALKDLAFVGSYDRNMWALRLETGELAWKFPTKGGIASSPAVDENARLVMFGSEDFTFYAVDYRTGRISWTYATKDRIRSSPRVAHDHVFFGSDDHKVYALGISTGRFLWGYDTGAPVRSRPFVTNDLVIVGSESGEVTAVTLSGNRKWSYRTKKGVIAAPVVDGEGNCYVASTDGWVYALDIGTGFNSWRYRTNGPIFSTPLEHDGLLYFGSTDSNFYCLNAETSREKWKFAAAKPIIGSAVYFKGTIYFGCTDEYLYCLEADTGKERWRFKTSAPITSAPYIAGDLLLVSSMDHKLYALPLVG